MRTERLFPSTGYVLVPRADRVMKVEERGGSIVFDCSKNALVASPGATACCTAKAAALHLARYPAVEGAWPAVRTSGRRRVFPADVAEAVSGFASARSDTSTDNILEVDAGNVAAFTR